MDELSLFGVPEQPKVKVFPIREADVVSVFEVWKDEVKSDRGPKVVLTEKRKKVIIKALKSHGLETCLQAVRGILSSPWHMGDNPGNKRYDSIELILRNAEKIEQFASYHIDSDQRSKALQEFLDS